MSYIFHSLLILTRWRFDGRGLVERDVHGDSAGSVVYDGGAVGVLPEGNGHALGHFHKNRFHREVRDVGRRRESRLTGLRDLGVTPVPLAPISE